MTTHLDWTAEQRAAVALAVDSYTENLSDQRGDPDVPDAEIDNAEAFSDRLRDPTIPLADVDVDGHRELVKTSVWLVLDAPEAFEPDECDPALLHGACAVLAGIDLSDLIEMEEA